MNVPSHQRGKSTTRPYITLIEVFSPLLRRHERFIIFLSLLFTDMMPAILTILSFLYVDIDIRRPPLSICQCHFLSFLLVIYHCQYYCIPIFSHWFAPSLPNSHANILLRFQACSDILSLLSFSSVIHYWSLGFGHWLLMPINTYYAIKSWATYLQDCLQPPITNQGHKRGSPGYLWES